MDKFVAQENILHFRGRLETETDPAKRSLLHKMMIEEEDKLGRNSETLQTVERHIADGKARVDTQRALVAGLERDGRDTTLAIAVLNRLRDTLLAFENQRAAIVVVIGESRL